MGNRKLVSQEGKLRHELGLPINDICLISLTQPGICPFWGKRVSALTLKRDCSIYWVCWCVKWSIRWKTKWQTRQSLTSGSLPPAPVRAVVLRVWSLDPQHQCTWEPVRNAHSPTPSWANNQTDVGRVGLGNLCLTSPLGDSGTYQNLRTAKVQKPEHRRSAIQSISVCDVL